MSKETIKLRDRLYLIIEKSNYWDSITISFEDIAKNTLLTLETYLNYDEHGYAYFKNSPINDANPIVIKTIIKSVCKHKSDLEYLNHLYNNMNLLIPIEI
jgi:hypothetical protein